MSQPGASPAHRRAPEAIPLTVLTGFLGAGKTTLLNTLVQDPAFHRSVVIINEFGDVPIDHLLVEQADGDLLTLASGCICCTVQGDLVAMLEDLLRRRDNDRMPPFDRVVIETTGLADPGPILNAVARHPYLMLRFRIDGIVTVVDALHGEASLDRHPEAVDQVAVADVVVLTKTELAAATEALGARLGALNPRAALLDAAAGEATAAAVLGIAPARTLARFTAVPADDPSPAGVHGGIGSFVLDATRPLEPMMVQSCLELLRMQAGPRLLRAKGVLALSDDPGRPLVVQIVQGVLHPLRRLAAWPAGGGEQSRLVVIGRGLDEGAIRGLWAAFFGPPAVDQPDGAALALRLSDDGPGLF